MKASFLRFTTFAIACVAITAMAQGLGQWYADPLGGWTYAYTGADAAYGDPTGTAGFHALDGTWSHENGSDSWDGSGLGGTFGDGNRPGGLQIFTEGNTTFARLQDCGDPRDHGFAEATANQSNRKLNLAHDLATEGVSGNFLDTGVTLAFRARVATTGLLDPQYPDADSSSSTGGENRGTAGGTAWQAGGNGYLCANDGKGNFTIRQQSTDAMISFSLTLNTDLRGDGGAFGTTGLTMNSRNGASPSSSVDPWQNEGTVNVLPMASLTDDFHEFWITIRADTTGGGTHRVEIYVDGALTPQVFHVTAGTGNDSQYEAYSFIAIGAGNTQQQGAFDVDYFAYKPGAWAPELGGLPTEPVGFSEQPAGVSLPEGAVAMFSVLTTGAPPRMVQWQRDDGAGGFTNIAGATSQSLDLGAVYPPDNGTAFRCLVTNSFSSATSEVAVLTVIADSNPPAVVKITGDPSLSHVWIYFSEKVDPTLAQSAINYIFDPPLDVLGAILETNGVRVMLETAPQPPGTAYTITLLDGIDDLAYTPNRLAADTVLPYQAWVLSRGFLCQEQYADITGTAVVDLTSHAKYPARWDTIGHVNSAEVPQTVPNLDYYGGRLIGWIVPPVDGDYLFFIRGDDGTELRLGTTEDPATVAPIASQAGANQPFSAGASLPIGLRGGQRYAIEALWKEHGGGDYVQIAWLLPGSTETNIIPCGALEAYADPTDGSATVVDQPQSQTVIQNRRVTVTVSAQVAPTNAPVVYFWQRGDGAGGFMEVAASTTNVFTSAPLVYPQDDQSSWRVIVAVPGVTATSMVATVTVSQDETGPRIVSAVRDFVDPNTLTVHYDEVVDEVSSLDGWNYTLVNVTENAVNELQFVPLVRSSDGRSVTLYYTDPITNGAVYRVQASVNDLVGNLGESQAKVTIPGALYPVGPQNLVVMEAEDADEVVPRIWEAVERTWEFLTDRAGYSGRGVMRAMPNTEGNRPIGSEATSLDFLVNFPSPATYYVWVRGAAEGGADNSCHVGLDNVVPDTGQNLTQGFDLGAGSGYVWESVRDGGGGGRATLDVTSAGVHRVQVFMREDGFYCDKVLITTDVNYTPVSVNGGLGPDPTRRESTAFILPLNSTWQANNLTLTWPYYGTVLQEAPAVTGPWTDISTVTNEYQVAPDGPARFYRVIIP